MRLILVTGMSGSGKSSVLHMLEDTGYFCVDNLPTELIPKFVELMMDRTDKMEKAALGVDIRSIEGSEAHGGTTGGGTDSPDAGELQEERKLSLKETLKELKAKGYTFEILFLDASTPVLVKRYKETRRTHPLADESVRIDDAIELERSRLHFLKEEADYIIDTSQMLVRDLRGEVDKILAKRGTYTSFFITILSFGFKYGIPLDCDLVMDVRFLPNPFYVDSLRHKTGNDPDVASFVMASGEGDVFLDQFCDMLMFLLPRYQKEGKNQLVIGIGCTGGRHRSVTIANALRDRLQGTIYGVKTDHRDIDRG